MLGLKSMVSRFLIRPQVLRQPLLCIHVGQIDAAARKGTRERREKLKKKAKVEIKKVGFIPHNQRKRAGRIVDKHATTDWKAIPTDDAYPGCYYRWHLYKVDEAIQAYKETHDPTMYNSLHSPLNVAIELDMKGEKGVRMVPNFQKIVLVDYPFEHGQDRKILAFAKEEDQQQQAVNAGAQLAGGSDLIKTTLKGDIHLSEYQFVVAHPNIMPELISLRGLMRKKFPSPKNETLGNDMHELVKKFMNGINYQALKDENQENFGLINTCIGTLNMPNEHLIANFNAILTSVNSVRPKRFGKFITRVLFTSPPSKEVFRIDPADFPFPDYDRIDEAKEKEANEKQFVRTYELFRVPV